MNAKDCLEKIKARLILSVVVRSVAIVSERALDNRGYFRARISLANGDFLEVSEYFFAGPDECQTIEYRHQWMDGAKTRLIRRWDNARHFPELANFPHHIHVAIETNAVPGKFMSIVALIDFLEAELE
jgi:hypothetical protein